MDPLPRQQHLADLRLKLTALTTELAKTEDAKSHSQRCYSLTNYRILAIFQVAFNASHHCCLLPRKAW